MQYRHLSCAALACLLGACGDEARDVVPAPDRAAPAPTETIAVPTPEVAPALPAASVGDTLGAFGGEVHGLALWEHPVISFASAVLAANGAAGLAVVPIDKQVEGRVVEGVFDGPVAIGYTQDTSFAAAASGDEVALFAIDDEGDFTRLGAVSAEADALCMVGGTLLVVGAEATGYEIDADGAAQAAFTVPGGEGAACASTADGFHLAVPGQPLRSLDASGVELTIDEAFEDVTAEGLAVLATPEGRAFVVLSEGRLFVDGPGAARTQIDTVRDGAPLPAPSLIAAGSGNYGSLYRDGVVAVVAGDELMVLPWAGVARAAGLDETQTQSLRPPGPVMPEPSIQLDLPEIETRLDPAPIP